MIGQLITADAAGLKTGDRIVQVDNANMTTRTVRVVDVEPDGKMYRVITDHNDIMLDPCETIEVWRAS